MIILKKINVFYTIFLLFFIFFTKNCLGEEFPLIDLKSLNNSENLNLNSFDSNYLLINFWASWCNACKYELKEIIKVKKDFESKGIKIITINLDEKTEKAKKFLLKNKLELPVYQPEEDMGKFLKIKVLPLNILIDNQRKILKKWEGYTPSLLDDLKNFIEKPKN
ncbi:MAG: TlpA disulfide reductase family protein [Thermoanaerobaculia bacterium]